MVVFLCVLGCEVSSEVNVTAQKFNVKLFVPEADGMTELWLRLESVCTGYCVECSLLVFLLLKTTNRLISPLLVSPQ